ncbi:alpha/beta-type small acid-soluble spore protein [Paenibacillus senegalensis]|uniref:alpha/beta-type small acid-soluble spore protein n=1 Tax=Paenibacillus senegalensis TaxID=1465766 RepID=UPI0002880071|nr:alpha/beta-type small acid-soluble spore protein [Paenibacillus senegalensis]
MAKSNKLVPESKQALDQLKYEIAAELGLPIGNHSVSFSNADAEFAGELGTFSRNSQKEHYWGHLSSRDTGAVGGTITKRLIQKAEETLFNL